LITGELLSEAVTVWLGTGDRWPEGPHIYKKDNLYYLMIAEGGGTNDGHCITIARSINIFGPYEPCPNNPILTHHRRVSQSNSIQALGHGDLIEAHDGSWWLLCLGIRPPYKHDILGRETFLAPVHWPKGGWPLVNGGNPLSENMDCPTLPQHSFPPKPVRDNFDSETLGLSWNYLRNPQRENYSLTDKKGCLTLTGSPLTLDDRDNPTFLGRRQQHKKFTATTQLEFSPAASNEIAGMTLYMSENYHYDFYLKKGNILVLRYKLSRLEHIEKEVKVKNATVQLRVVGNKDIYIFSYSDDGGKTFQTAGTVDMNFISRENAGGFSGVYIALYASGNGKRSQAKARFDRFDYQDYVNN
jgi:alpha-N-arabinofuranosidase